MMRGTRLKISPIDDDFIITDEVLEYLRSMGKEKIMYNTREEVENAWPLGTVVSEEPLFQRFYCADEIMFEKIKNWFKDDEVKQTSKHHVTVTRNVKKTIEGYLYNGEKWFPMMHDGREWRVYIPETF